MLVDSHPRRFAPMLVAFGLVAGIAPHAPAGDAAAAAQSDCRAISEGPFFYEAAGLVLPATRIECTTVKNRIRIFTVLTRDGTRVASARRVCSNRNVCHITVDASAPDEPGNQRWCTTTRGHVGKQFVGEAASCESF